MADGPFYIRPAGPEAIEIAVAIDDAASSLYAHAGIELAFDDEHPVVREERCAWDAEARAGGLLFAVAESGEAVGFIALGRKDGLAYVDQLSVHPAHMRRGIGRALMARGRTWALAGGTPAIVLTTWDHIPWNRPYYTRLGYRIVDETDWGPEIARVIAFQRAHLPVPECRVVMRLDL